MTRVKICGITRLEDALLAAEAGADLLGFIFYPASPRYLPPQPAGRIAGAVRRAFPAVSLVGVFVDEEPAAVQQVMARCGLDYAQLHGREPPETVAALMAGGLRVIKGFRLHEGVFPAEIASYRASAYLLDAFVPGRPGGSGQTCDWTLAAQAGACGPVLLAGGLTPDNVAAAVRAVHPWGVDVASGVEFAPGQKDPEKVRRFIAAAKEA